MQRLHGVKRDRKQNADELDGKAVLGLGQWQGPVA